MVETYMRAHKDQMPEEAWLMRKQEWTADVSAKSWARTLRSIAEDSNSQDCIYVAVNDESEKHDGSADIVGLVMGGPGEMAQWQNVAEIYALYVCSDYQRQGVGRRLLQAVVAQLAQLRMTSLIIKCLTGNASASRFYAAMGGQVIGITEFEEYGYKLPEQIFGWEYISTFPTSR